MKEIRNPWIPRLQSMAFVHGSKEPKRVREHDSEGRRDFGIGANRVSLKALNQSRILVSPICILGGVYHCLKRERYSLGNTYESKA